MEDPETGKLIPSTGKRGRKKGSGSDTGNTNKKKEEIDYRLLYEQCKKESMDKDMLVRALQKQNKSLRSCIKRISEIAGTIISSESD